MIAVVIGLSVLCCVLIGLIIWLAYNQKGADTRVNNVAESYREQLKDRRETINSLTEQLQKYEQACGKLDELYTNITKLQAAKEYLTGSITKEQELMERERQFLEEERKKHSEDSSQRIVETNEALHAAFAEQSDIEKNITELEQKEKELDKAIEGKIRELDSLAETYKAAILAAEKDNINTDENGFEVTLLPQYERMVKLLRELEGSYPELKTELSKIEWSKVWMPQFQQKLKAQSWSGGCIYRLVLKSDPNICYVGQARDLKDRWYQHAKKMLGVDSKGNERLYNYHPEDFIWTVIEDKVADVDLDNKEHYWINHYACLSVGLNKRK